MVKILIYLMLLPFVSGCGTIAARVSKQNVPDVKIYPATAVDAAGFYFFCCTNMIHMEGKQPLGTTIALRTIVPALMILDAPVSLVTDTVLLPYDFYKWSHATNSGESPIHEDAPEEKSSATLSSQSNVNQSQEAP